MGLIRLFLKKDNRTILYLAHHDFTSILLHVVGVVAYYFSIVTIEENQSRQRFKKKSRFLESLVNWITCVLPSVCSVYIMVGPIAMPVRQGNSHRGLLPCQCKKPHLATSIAFYITYIHFYFGLCLSMPAVFHPGVLFLNKLSRSRLTDPVLSCMCNAYAYAPVTN
jgi:hypothetical protein